MSRVNTLALAGLLIAVSVAPPAKAQTSNVAHLAVQSGNGQAACICTTATLQAFQPISVLATDVNGNPVSGATVSWTLTSGQMTLATPTSVTGGNGIATENISLIILNNYTSTAVPYLVATIQATSNSSSVTFTENQSLVTTQGSSVIEASSPTFNGNNLSETTFSANTGTSLATPIIVDVAGLELASNGVGNVAVHIINEQVSPTITCANVGGYADPGSVLSNAQGFATCYPVFSGSGTGQFYITIGGVPSTDISTALYLQSYPLYIGAGSSGYSFTVIPGAPTALRIVSGNNQVGAVGVPLNPLVAKLVDVNGNAVQNQAVTWTVVPAGAVALNDNTVTDNNGEVTAQITLDALATAGVTITVALASNPNIAVTFQESTQNAITNLNIVSGNGQSAQQGTNFAQPLAVQVLNGSAPVANYPVQFQISGPVSIPLGTIAGTNTNGIATVTVQAGALAGTATVTAVAGAKTVSFNLTITSTPNAPPPNGISIVLGNNQTVTEGAGFTPLTVQVNSTAGPVSGYVVGFTSTGPVTLSSNAATTNSSGQASVNVLAGSSPGAATVTASITGYAQTFNLNVSAPGPVISPASFLNGATRQVGFISPCSLAILSAQGLTPAGASDYYNGPVFGRWPKSVSGLSITFNGIPAPIKTVAMGTANPEVTFQVPCEVTPASSVPVVVNVAGGGTATTNVAVLTVSPGVFTSVESDGVNRAVVVRQDGSFVDVGDPDQYDPSNPVRQNENVFFYVTGLGATFPAMTSDDVEAPLAFVENVEPVVTGTVQVGIVGSGGLTVVSTRQAPGQIGVYEVQVAIPGTTPTGNSIPVSICIVPAGAPSSTPGTCPNVNPIIPIAQ